MNNINYAASSLSRLADDTSIRRQMAACTYLNAVAALTTARSDMRKSLEAHEKACVASGAARFELANAYFAARSAGVQFSPEALERFTSLLEGGV